MPFFPDIDADAIFLSRYDDNELLGSFAACPFDLDNATWPSSEHYFQAMKFNDASLREAIRHAASAKEAQQMGRKRNMRKHMRDDWSNVKTTVMTRAIYIQCRSDDDKAQALLGTGGVQIIENHGYDYYWGCGRDRRGANHFGKVLMNVRNKLLKEQQEATANG